MVDGRDHCLFALQGFPDVLLRQLQHAPATNFIELKPQQALRQWGCVRQALQDRVHEACIAQVLEPSTLYQRMLSSLQFPARQNFSF